MIKFVHFLRDVFATVLALFGTFWLGMTFGVKLLEKGVDKVFEDESKERSRKVSYKSFYDRKRD